MICLGKGIIKVPSVTKINPMGFYSWKRKGTIGSNNVTVFRQIPANFTKNPEASFIVSM
jgi:hypothetical protein